MSVSQLLTLLVAAICFFAALDLGDSIAREVQQVRGTPDESIWNSRANQIWMDHERLFPDSRKRRALAATLIAAFGLFFAAAWLGH